MSLIATGGYRQTDSVEGVAANQVFYTKFTTAAHSGISVFQITIGVQAASSGAKMRLGIYTDSAGSPGSLVAGSSDYTFPSAVATGSDVDVTVALVASLSGSTNYWLAVHVDTDTTFHGSVGTQDHGSQSSVTFSGGFPSTASYTPLAADPLRIYIDYTYTGTPTGTGLIAKTASYLLGGNDSTIHFARAELPDGRAVGDVAIVAVTFLTLSGVAPTLSTPTGWTLIGNAQHGTITTYRLMVLYKVLDGTEPGCLQVVSTTGSSAQMRSVTSIHRGYNGYEGAATNNNRTTTATGSSVTTTGDDRTVVTVYSLADGLSNGTPDAAWTEQYDYTSDSTTDASIGMLTKEQATAGVVAAATTTVSFLRWGTVTFALIQQTSVTHDLTASLSAAITATLSANRLHMLTASPMAAIDATFGDQRTVNLTASLELAITAEMNAVLDPPWECAGGVSTVWTCT